MNMRKVSFPFDGLEKGTSVLNFLSTPKERCCYRTSDFGIYIKKRPGAEYETQVITISVLDLIGILPLVSDASVFSDRDWIPAKPSDGSVASQT